MQNDSKNQYLPRGPYTTPLQYLLPHPPSFNDGGDNDADIGSPQTSVQQSDDAQKRFLPNNGAGNDVSPRPISVDVESKSGMVYLCSPRPHQGILLLQSVQGKHTPSLKIRSNMAVQNSDYCIDSEHFETFTGFMGNFDGLRDIHWQDALDDELVANSPDVTDGPGSLESIRMRVTVTDRTTSSIQSGGGDERFNAMPPGMSNAMPDNGMPSAGDNMDITVVNSTTSEGQNKLSQTNDQSATFGSGSRMDTLTSFDDERFQNHSGAWKVDNEDTPGVCH